MSEMEGQGQANTGSEAQDVQQTQAPYNGVLESNVTTIQAFKTDRARLKDLKKKLKYRTNPEVVKYLLDFAEGKVKEEMIRDGVQRPV